MTRTATVTKILVGLKTTKTEMLAPPPVTDPRAAGLNDEDLEMARAFHDSPTAVRLGVSHVLASRVASSAVLNRVMQIAALAQHDQRMLDTLLQVAKAFDPKTAAAERPVDLPQPAIKSKA